MKVVNISDAKNNLSRHLAFVRRGGRIRILDRNEPVADLIPVEADGSPDDDARMLELLERRGIVRRGTGGPLPRELLRPGPSGGRAGVVDALLAERRSSG
ncbi:MAG: type II toxin-antitoxin system Phd/YefM family antitoxin [Myxococcota bacterium]|nr:type II toxin-antitoxin system Phd/YefM family antitoxin [Myxococcota bacterium]